MYNVSNAYKQEIRKELMEQGFVRITFGIIDPDATSDAEVSTTAGTDYSQVPRYEGTYDAIVPYGTFEDNIWILDGMSRFKPEDSVEYNYQGFVGASLSDADGNYTSKPALTITFDQDVYAFRGISLTFDKLRGNRPKTVTIVGSLGGTENYRKTVPVNSVDFYYEGNIPSSGNFVDKIQIIFDNTAVPDRRMRVEYLILGVTKVLTNDDISSASWERANDLMNTSIPQMSFSWQFIDENGDYNPDNPEGLFGLLEANQPVKFEFGQTLEDGSVEWILSGNYLTDGAPTVEASSSLSTVSFKAVSHLERLNEIYYYGAIGTYTLFQLTTEVLTFAFGGTVDPNGTPYFIVDESLKQIKTSCPLPMEECKVLLQLIANAGMCVLDENRNGQVTITKRSYGTPVDFHYDEDLLREDMPTVNKYPILKTVTSKLYSYTANPATGEDSDEVGSYESEIVLNNETVIVEHDVASINSVTLDTETPTTFTYTSVQHYARCSIFTGLSGKGRLILHGVPYEENTSSITKTYNIIGDDCPIENQLITDITHLNNYMDWIASITKRRNQYSLQDFGHPELDMCDDVYLDTLFSTQLVGTVTSSKISFSGGLSGDTEVLIVNTESEV